MALHGRQTLMISSGLKSVSVIAAPCMQLISAHHASNYRLARIATLRCEKARSPEAVVWCGACTIAVSQLTAPLARTSRATLSTPVRTGGAAAAIAACSCSPLVFGGSLRRRRKGLGA